MVAMVAINDIEVSGARYSDYFLSEGTEKIAENIRKISFFKFSKFVGKITLGYGVIWWSPRSQTRSYS